MPEIPAAEAIADFAVRLRFEDIPSAVAHRAKLHILDGLGLGLASTAYDFGRVAVDAALSLGGGGPCSIIGAAKRVDPRDAALANGVLIHGLDFDDTHLASIIHATTTALPVALALGEAVDASGAEMLTAFLAGAETAIRIGLAADGGFHHVGFHATGVVSHFASAVTAGRLLGLSAAQITAAQGIAGSTAAGTQVFLEEGAWTKRFHPGWGAVAGITAAQLARSGFKGPTRPYEGKFGLFETHLHQPARLAAMTSGLGEQWHFGDTALKPYPVCHFIHGCADAAIDLHGQIAGSPIASVEALLPEPTLHIIAEPAEAKQRPTNEYEAKFSAQYVVAACLLRGFIGLADLRPEALADPAVLALAGRVKTSADPNSAFPEFFSGGVRVTLEDGRTLERHVRVNSGAGDRVMSAEQVAAKFAASASLAIAPARVEAIRSAVMELERIKVRDLTALLAS